MGLDKAIEHGKEHRKPYTGSKANRLFKRGNGQITMAELEDDEEESTNLVRVGY